MVANVSQLDHLIMNCFGFVIVCIRYRKCKYKQEIHAKASKRKDFVWGQEGQQPQQAAVRDEETTEAVLQEVRMPERS